jgi:UDP-N-acetylglucosamine diphosphorylase/glucosamine-1-phosphate N-acetyltransferase
VQIVLFEDDRASQLEPLAAAEPAFAICCGSYRLVYLLRAMGPICTLVRKHLRAVEATSYPERVPPEKLPAGPVLFVNARLVPSVSVLGRLKAIVESGREGQVVSGDGIAAALVTRTVELPRGDDANSAVAPRIKSLNLPSLAGDFPLFEYPHDVLRHHLQCCRENLEHRLKNGYREVRDGLFVAENVTLGEPLVTDTKQGPILIDHDAVVGPLSYLRGPVYIGPKARIIEHASIKDAVSLGHTTKVGGEVEASVLEPYTNKVHHGYLGHSYLGSWVNFGAGTTNSDLKNTYGPVNMEYRGRKVGTGMQFVGCFVGDYVKTAINTSIFTGKTIGVCSMVYGFVTANVPAFCNYAQSFGQVTDLPAGQMIAFQQRVFARRQVDQRECDIQLLRDLYEMARREQKLPDEPLTL